MKKIIFVLLLIPNLAFATFAEDKDACYTYSNNLKIFAELRDESMPRDTLIDKTLALADTNDWPAEGTLALMYMIQYVYAHPEIAPAVLKKTAYTACMKNRGHTLA
jgi:hypothetical protein